MDSLSAAIAHLLDGGRVVGALRFLVRWVSPVLIVAVMLRESPFYAESGGQVSDRGTIEGPGWRVTVCGRCSCIA